MSGQLTQAQLQAQVRTAELGQQGQMLRQLGQLGDLMLAAQSLEEGGQIAVRALPQLLPDSAGTLFK